ncbi:MAG: hypothetical protein LBR42_04305, partial [Candidatus Methanoplasma sp.]|nr:hypothetical protein [Candidatus Methanoplasma sp.]
MAYAGRTGRNSMLGSAIGIVLLAAAIVVLVVFVALNPHIIENLAYIALIVIAAIVIIAVIVYLAMAILALPYYVAKGEEYQT